VKITIQRNVKLLVGDSDSDSHAAVIHFRARAATAFGARKWRAAEKWICAECRSELWKLGKLH